MNEFFTHFGSCFWNFHNVSASQLEGKHHVTKTSSWVAETSWKFQKHDPRRVKKFIQIQSCSYIVLYPIRRIAQSALYFTPWQTRSLRRQPDFSRKHWAVTARRPFTHIISTTVYSLVLIYTAESTTALLRKQNCPYAEEIQSRLLRMRFQ